MQNNTPVGDYQFGFFESDENYSVKLPKGLSREVVEAISKYKNEPIYPLFQEANKIMPLSFQCKVRNCHYVAEITEDSLAFCIKNRDTVCIMRISKEVRGACGLLKTSMDNIV